MEIPAAPRLRSPWARIALAFGVFLVLANMIGFLYLLAAAPPFDPKTTDMDALSTLLKDPRMLAGLLTAQALAGVLTVIFMTASIDRRPIKGLGVRKEFGGLAWGLFLGAVCATAVTLFISAVGKRHVEAVLFRDTERVEVLLFAIVVVAAAFMEELLFRGYLYVNLREMYSAGRTVVFSSLAFATVHASNPEASVLAWVNVMLVGAVLGQLREITGGILMPLGLHVGWNLSLGMIFGVRVSGLNLPSAFRISLEDLPSALGGGDFGPEASLVLTFLFMVIVILLSRWIRPPAGESGSMIR
ncbi:MAG TPA: CPBP family intramembrane glutamic endopeptidase [Candidatus Eisenbacteria bacterium]|nr:CPBP family intramembrane glutamic endopeptidase [Candidatus Eisenbacteria bacterium]